MLAYLDSKRYSRFKKRLGKFLRTPGAGAQPVFSRDDQPLPHRLRHVVPVVVYQRLADVRAYDEWVTGPEVPLERLHQLRIAFKRLRYTLEFFEEVLGPEAKRLIEDIKAMQDHLGALQDAGVASALLRDFLTHGTWSHTNARKKKKTSPPEPSEAAGVEAYLETKQAEIQHLLDTFPEAWARFQSPAVSELVAAAVAHL
jgi:CHAD domain-containing protein